MSKNTPEPNPGERKRVTLRDIAKELGVSHVTVSKALRNQSGASPELKARIRKKADEMGYQPDPMLAALSHYRKTSTTHPVQASLAWINTWPEPEQLREFKEFDLYWQGAEASAQRFGFRLQEFQTAEIPLPRLHSILKARNIQGILIPPLADLTDEWMSFPWADFATVRLGRSTHYPETHFVTGAQTADTILAFNRSRELGYKRIGFVCEYLYMRFFGVGFTWAQKQCPKDEQIPLLSLKVEDSLEKQQRALGKWIKKNHPDAILTDNSGMLEMLTNLGYRIPEDVGLATMSIHDTPIDAGINQKPFEIGRTAVRTLVSLINEHSFGIPETLNEILIEGNWVDGSMLPRREA